MKSRLNIISLNTKIVSNRILIYQIKYVNFKDNLHSKIISIHKY